jgi:hypothetical protein
VAAFYQRPEERAVREEWVDGLAGVLRQGEPAGYVNFVPDDSPGRVAEAYPEPTLTRLREVKARFDPENLFRRNVNIPPA